MKAVLLVVDNPHREMRGMVAIWQRLLRSGVFAHIASKRSFNDWAGIIQPEVIVVPRATSEFKSFMEKHHRHVRFVTIPSEHGLGFRHKVLNNAFGPNYWSRKENTSAIDLSTAILVGGENQKKWLVEERPDLEKKIAVVGTLSSDHWFKPKVISARKKSVGICTTFKSLLLSTSANSVHRLLYQHLSPGYGDNAWRLPFQYCELAYLGKLFEVIDVLIEHGYHVDIRPHPHEYWSGWKRWHRWIKQDAVSLNRDIDLAAWIDRQCACITTFSTMTLDCIVRDVPSISLERFVADEIERIPEVKTPMKGDYSWKPESLDELIEMLDKSQAQRLSCSPNRDLADQFVKANFSFPRKESAATLCTHKILEILEHSKERERQVKKRIAMFPYRLLKILSKDLVDVTGPRRANLLYTFSIKSWVGAYRFNRDITV